MYSSLGADSGRGGGREARTGALDAAGQQLAPCHVLQVLPTVQHYAWGKLGQHSAVSYLQAGGTGEVDQLEPYAELWMGTHVKSPSHVRMPDGEELPLLGVLDGEELPYLFKVLSVRTALSIQAHPHKALAEELHRARPDVYRDDNHKPEMACAVTHFRAMCGFRPVSQVAFFLSSVTEFRTIVSDEVAQQLEEARSEMAETRAALVAVFERVMKCSPDVLEAQIASLVGRLRASSDPEEVVPQLNTAEDHDLPVGKLMLRLADQYPGDVGIFAPLLLNCFELEPGQSIFLGPNEPHAYLDGDCVEVMACSDNVVRAGLTAKLRDVDTLCSMLTYEALYPDISDGLQLDAHTRIHQPPVLEFGLTETVVRAPPGGHADADGGAVAAYRLPGLPGPCLLLVYHGFGHVRCCESDTSLDVHPGSVVLVRDGADVLLEHVRGMSSSTKTNANTNSSSHPVSNDNDTLVVFRCFAPMYNTSTASEAGSDAASNGPGGDDNGDAAEEGFDNDNASVMSSALSRLSLL